jgi:peroxidase
VNSWDDLRGLMSNKTVNAYSRLYETPNDLDLWSAGISETPLTGKQI